MPFTKRKKDISVLVGTEKQSVQETRLRFGWLIYAILALSIGFTIAAWYNTRATIQAQAHTKFLEEATNTSHLVSSRIDAYISTINSMKGLFAASENNVERTEFSAYAQELQLRERFPGLLALYYAEKVSIENKDAFVEKVRADLSVSPEGYPNFEISSGGEKQELYVINFIEPYALYKEAHGLDIGSRPATLAAVEKARDTGKPQITGRFPLEDNEKTQEGFVVFFPIYEKGVPIYTLRERQAAVIGFIGAVFKSHSFFQSIIGDNLGENRIALTISDAAGFTPDHTLYDNIQNFPDENKKAFDFSEEISLPVTDSNWVLQFATLPRFHLTSTQESLPLLVALGGGIFDILLFIVLYTMATSRRRALNFIDKMTADLRVYADIVKNMKTSLLVFRLENSEDDHSLKLILANPSSLPRLKAQVEGDLLGKTLDTLQPQTHPDTTKKFAETARTKNTSEFEDTLDTKDGKLTYLVKSFPLPDSSVGVMYDDITSLKNIENDLRTRSEELKKTNSYMVDRELKMIQLKKEIQDLQGEIDKYKNKTISPES